MLGRLLLPVHCMLLLKLTLIPTLLYALSLVARYRGPALAGWLSGLPVVAGPILWLLAHEQGKAFAAVAAMQAIAAIAASEAFNLIYARTAARRHWPLALAAALGGWLLAALLLQQLTPSLLLALGVAALSVGGNYFCLPRPAQLPPDSPSHERLWLRMLAAAVLTLAVSAAAQRLGAAWSGVLAVFPLLGVVMAVSMQQAQGAAAVQMLLRGMLLGRFAFAAFCLTLVLLLPRLDRDISFLLASLLSLLAQSASRRGLRP
ncbi:hypothetical protein DFR38_10372 [Aquitalea magnusonii]|uniref:Uncharacterized protein n=2 Tax=Aquitalea magnusonii TaxID=332411 RepID=A0A318JIJ1_9NEIS|nr:hypothetical protein DFR38_10372 [Aquitalea magnusonii]